MNTFYIARHGQTLNNRDGRLSGWIDTPLTEEGYAATDRAIEKIRPLGIEVMYSSDMGRSFLTAYRIARSINYNDEIILEPRLREINYGDAGNMRRDEAYLKYPGIDSDTNVRPPNGGTGGEMQAKVICAIFDINESNDDKRILLVAHSGTMAAVSAYYRGVDFGGVNISESFEHDAVVELTVDDGKIATFGFVQ